MSAHHGVCSHSGLTSRGPSPLNFGGKAAHTISTILIIALELVQWELQTGMTITEELAHSSPRLAPPHMTPHVTLLTPLHVTILHAEGTPEEAQNRVHLSPNS